MDGNYTRPRDDHFYEPDFSRPTIDELPSLLVGAASVVRRVKLNQYCGIYFLVDSDNEVIYIGKSICTLQRIRGYRGGKGMGFKDFDRAYYLPLREEVIDEYELALIRVLRPKLNGDTEGSGRVYHTKFRKPPSDREREIVQRLLGMVNITNLV